MWLGTRVPYRVSGERGDISQARVHREGSLVDSTGRVEVVRKGKGPNKNKVLRMVT